jgi:quinol monooxygenase YgiN
MSKVALNVVLEFKPESKEEIVRSLLAHRQRCLKDEPGTIQFEIMVPIEEPSKLFLFELYADESAFAAHSQGTSLARYLEEVKTKVLKAAIAKCSLGSETRS